jgi:hypothetical protein
MPILKGSEGLKIAKSFGVQNIRQLQQLVKAKVDGQFGPETFFKAKVFIANEMNKPNADKAKLEAMLNSLGSDDELETMKSNIGVTSNSEPTQEDDGIPETLKSTWNELTADGKLTKADHELLVKAAAPNMKNSEFDDSELEFLATIKEMFEKNNVDELEIQKPEVKSKPQQTTAKKETTSSSNVTSDDGIPKTLKSTWDKITADGKLTKADYELLVKAASPNMKNNEFDDSELEFLATIKEMFEKNKVDELDVQKPEVKSKPQQTVNTKTTTKPSSPSISAKNFSPPETLKAAWSKAISDGKVNDADFETLMKAASPNKKNVEFENDEIEFLADLKEKIKASGGTLNISK